MAPPQNILWETFLFSLQLLLFAHKEENQVIYLWRWSFSCPPLLPSSSHPLALSFCLPLLSTWHIQQDLEDHDGDCFHQERKKETGKGAKMLDRVPGFSHQLGTWLSTLLVSCLCSLPTTAVPEDCTEHGPTLMADVLPASLTLLCCLASWSKAPQWAKWLLVLWLAKIQDVNLIVCYGYSALFQDVILYLYSANQMLFRYCSSRTFTSIP